MEASDIEYLRLARIKPYKKDHTYSYTEGVFPTLELIDNAPDAVVKVIVSSKSTDSEGAALLERKCRALCVPFTVDDGTIARLSPKGSVMAVGVFIKMRREIVMSHDHIVLVNPSDMGNVGTILRTAAAFGFFDIAIIEPAADHFDPKEYSYAAGAREYMPFMLNGQNMDDHTPALAHADTPTSLIFGNESSGLDERFLSVGTPLRIDHLPTVDSLNLTIAAGIAMHWFTRTVRMPQHRKEVL